MNSGIALPGTMLSIGRASFMKKQRIRGADKKLKETTHLHINFDRNTLDSLSISFDRQTGDDVQPLSLRAHSARTRY